MWSCFNTLKHEDEEERRESRGDGRETLHFTGETERVPDLKVSRQRLLVLSVDKAGERS
jgi:hypothetical protein